MKSSLSKIILAAAGLALLGAGCVQFGGSTQSAQGPVGMYRSSDKGETWQAIASYPTAQGMKTIAGVNIYRVFTDPSDPNALYLGTRGQGMFYSYDNGTTWQRAEPLSGKYIYAVAVDPANKCNIYVSDGLNIYKSIDCSRTWNLIYSEQRPTERFVGLAIDFANPNIVYGAELNGDVLKSVDGGASWQAIKRFDTELQAIQTDPQTANRLYVASHTRGLYRSDDSGQTWNTFKDVFSNFSEANNFYRLYVHPKIKGSVYWISKYGILHSTDAGETWNEIKLITPPGSVNIYAFGLNPNDDKEMYYVGTILGDQNTAPRSTFYKTIDGGKTWLTRKLPTNTVPIAIHVHPVNPSVIFIGFTTLTQ